MNQEEDVQVPPTSKDNDQSQECTKYKLNRSISLSKIEQDPSKEESNPKKRKNPPSPKGKVNVKQTNLKDTNKEKTKFKRNAKKSPAETIEDPIPKLMKEMMADIKEIKNDVKGNNSKIDELTNKVENLEVKSKEADEKNSNTFEELKDEISQVEERVTSKLLKEIEPSLNGMKHEIQESVSVDIRRLVQKEMSLQK